MSAFPAYTSSRTPVLDVQLARSMRDEPVLSADEAHRLAGIMLDDKTPLRTPVLEDQLSLARSEFANPAYVDAIIRNMALQDPLACYDREDLGVIAGVGTEVPSTIAGVAGCLLAEHEHLVASCCDPAESLDDVFDDVQELDERLALFTSPFDLIAGRFRDSMPAVRDRGVSMLSRHRYARFAGDYRSIAENLGMLPSASLSRVLRFALIPTCRYIEGAARLGVSCPEPKDADECSWMLGTYLDYRGLAEAGDLGVRMDRLCRCVLEPLARAGRKAGAAFPEQATATLQLL